MAHAIVSASWATTEPDGVRDHVAPQDPWPALEGVATSTWPSRLSVSVESRPTSVTRTTEAGCAAPQARERTTSASRWRRGRDRRPWWVDGQAAVPDHPAGGEIQVADGLLGLTGPSPYAPEPASPATPLRHLASLRLRHPPNDAPGVYAFHRSRSRVEFKQPLLRVSIDYSALPT